MSIGISDPWTPWAIPRSTDGTVASGCLAAWWSTADHGTSLMTDDGAGLISNWIDRINGMAVTAAAATRPTWAATSFNSAYPGLTFDGVATTGNCMVNNTTFATFFPTAAIAGEIWLVGSVTTTAGVTSMVYYGGTGTNGRALRKTANSNYLSVYDGATNNNGAANALTSPFVGMGNFSGTSSNGYTNGVWSGTNPTTIAALNTTTTRFRIGSNNASPAGAQTPMVITDILILNGLSIALTMSGRGTTVKQDIEGWAANTYGFQSSLAATHPWRYTGIGGP